MPCTQATVKFYSRAAKYTGVCNYTPDLLFGAIDYENITDSYGVVTDCLFHVIIFPLSIDVIKGGI